MQSPRACELVTFAPRLKVPRFLAYIGSFYQCADDESIQRIHVLADDWPTLIESQLRRHEKINIIKTQDFAPTVRDHSNSDSRASLVSYLKFIHAIIESTESIVISHYRPGLFLGSLKPLISNSAFDLISFDALKNCENIGLISSLLAHVENSSVCFYNKMTLPLIAAMIEESAEPDKNNNMSTNAAYSKLRISAINDPTSLLVQSSAESPPPYLSGEDGVPACLSQRFKSGFWNDSGTSTITPDYGNYADPILLEEWLIAELYPSRALT